MKAIIFVICFAILLLGILLVYGLHSRLKRITGDYPKEIKIRANVSSDAIRAELTELYNVKKELLEKTKRVRMSQIVNRTWIDGMYK